MNLKIVEIGFTGFSLLTFFFTNENVNFRSILPILTGYIIHSLAASLSLK